MRVSPLRRGCFVKTVAALGEAEYRAWLGHTQHCPNCRTGVSCPTATKHGRAWREARG